MARRMPDHTQSWREPLTEMVTLPLPALRQKEFTAAAKGSSPDEVKKAAAKIKQNCDSCHTVFK